MPRSSLIRVFVLFGTLLLSCFAFAGPLVVGNGGGVAELKAIYMHQNLAGYVAGCLVRANPCGLRAEEVTSLQLVLQNHSNEAVQVVIKFDANQAAPVATQARPGAEITISNKALYNETGLPKATGQIGALVLAARWSHFSAQPLAELYQRALAIFGSFQEQSERVNIGEFNSGLRFHVNFWRFQSANQLLLLLEDDRTTLNLTEEVEKILPCGKLLDWKWENLQAFAAEPTAAGTQTAVTIEISSSCEANTPKRTLLIKALAQEKSFVKSSIQILLRAE